MTVTYGNNNPSMAAQDHAFCASHCYNIEYSQHFQKNSLFVVSAIGWAGEIDSNFRFQYRINRMAFVNFRHCRCFFFFNNDFCFFSFLIFIFALLTMNVAFLCIFFWSMHSLFAVWNATKQIWNKHKIVRQCIANVPYSSTSTSHVQSVNGTMELSLFSC